MISLQTNQSAYYNDLSDVVRLFFGMEQITENGEGEIRILHQCVQEGDVLTETCEIRWDRTQTRTRQYEIHAQGEIERIRLEKRYAKLCLYELLKDYCGMTPPWGGLTGIRPTRLARQLCSEGRTLPETLAYMRQIFDVSPEKTSLVEDILMAQRDVYVEGDAEYVDVYIGIPFCKTRCLYCSFYSAGIKDAAVVDEYVNGLLKEIDALAQHMKGQRRKVRAVYFGGGTPTAIGDAHLARILDVVNQAFGKVSELTVEAGRPDTITPDTFPMLVEKGVNRVSINPQSMNARTLEIIGRSHTPEEIYTAYELAKAAGIRQINMDIIVGLPGEDRGMLQQTLDALKPLNIENFTVHTLAIKRSSRLKERIEQYALADAAEAEAMLRLAEEDARRRGMVPYYMYRQKYMRGNLENVGYCLPGQACIYNIDMMEETHNILALGSGVSRRMFFDRELHTRLANAKDVRTYLNTLDAQIEKKKEFFTWEE